MSAGVSTPPRLIEPVKRRVTLSEIRTSWPVSKMLAVRDFTITFKQTALGPVWLLLQPLGMLAAITVVFSEIADITTGSDIPYPLFSMVGVIVYGFVQLSLGFGVRCFVTNKLLVKHVACPRLALVNTKAITSLLQPILMTTLAIIAIVATGYGPPLQVVILPVLFLWLGIFAWGAMLGLASLNVRYRDVAVLLPYGLQLALLCAPVAYPLGKVPDAAYPFFVANPITGMVEAWRWTLLGASPDLLAVGVSLAVSAVLVIVSWRIFTRLEVQFADVI